MLKRSWACLHSTSRGFRVGQRNLSRSSKPPKQDKVNYNVSPFVLEEDVQHLNYKRVTAEDLVSYPHPPRKAKMLVRDFIHDSLYNPHYGYFPKNAVIFSPNDPFDFGALQDQAHFQEAVAERYAEHGATTVNGMGPGRQIWHTPTELFKPWYGRAIAKCLVSEYLLKHFPYEDFVIYEMGAGNGTLALNVLDFVREEYPEVYERTRYRIIEISPNLANIQRKKLSEHHACVEIINKSVFDWDEFVAEPCFFVALEVIDNFPHDVVRYRLDDLRPYQAITVIDEHGDFDELYEPVQDPLIQRFLNYRSQAHHASPALASPLISSPSARYIRRNLPFAPNLTPKPEFIPTRLLTFLEVLRDKFPLHRLLLSDFSSLPDSLKGYNTPVVQTRFQDTMVPVETYLVQQGYFDIFFPTSFPLLRDLYQLVMNMPRVANEGDSSPTQTSASEEHHREVAQLRRSPIESVSSTLRLESDFFLPKDRRPRSLSAGEQRCKIYTHKEFMERYAKVRSTQLRNGENPLLAFYQNVKFIF